MKIINQGQDMSDPPVNWWVGQQWQCQRCGCIIELEEGDQVEAVSPSITAPAMATTSCPNCDTSITYTNTPE